MKLPSTGRMAALAAAALLIGLAAVPIPGFSPLTNELRAFAGAGLALWAADSFLRGPGLGLRALFSESVSAGAWRRLRPALKAVAAYLAAMLCLVSLLWALSWAAGALAGVGPSGAEAYAGWLEAGNAQKARAAGTRWDWLPWRYAWPLLLAPVIEELFFRRLLYVWLRRRRGTALSSAVSAACFGLFHAPAPLSMLAAAVLGLFLCRLYEARRDYGACVAAHALNNLFAVLLFRVFFA